MKVALITGSSENIVAGTVNAFEALSRMFNENSSIDVIKINAGVSSDGFFRLMRSMYTCALLVKKCDPEIICIEGLWLWPVIVGYPRSLKIVSLHGGGSEHALEYGGILKKCFKNIWFGRMKKTKSILRICNSNELNQLSTRLKEFPYFVIENPYSYLIKDFPKFDNHRLVTDAKVNLIFIGRDHPIKNLDLLHSYVKNSSSVASMYFAGFDFTFSRHQNLADLEKNCDDLIFIGIKPVDQLLRLINCIPGPKALVLLSKSEGSAAVVFESVFMNIPVLVSSGAAPCNVETAGVGFLVRSIDEFEDALHRLVGGFKIDPENRDIFLRRYDINSDAFLHSARAAAKD